VSTSTRPTYKQIKAYAEAVSFRKKYEARENKYRDILAKFGADVYIAGQWTVKGYYRPDKRLSVDKVRAKLGPQTEECYTEKEVLAFNVTRGKKKATKKAKK
jgi:hypothetical protein